MDDVPGLRPYPPEKVVAWSPGWARSFAGLAASVSSALPGWAVEHVGSTSVPGLCAKPVLDVALRAPAGVPPSAVRALGWAGPVDLGTHLAVFALDAGGVRRAIAHVYRFEDWDDAAVRLFAARLRRCPDEAAEYARLKESLVAAGVWGAAYTEAKTAFVEAAVARERALRHQV